MSNLNQEELNNMSLENSKAVLSNNPIDMWEKGAMKMLKDEYKVKFNKLKDDYPFVNIIIPDIDNLCIRELYELYNSSEKTMLETLTVSEKQTEMISSVECNFIKDVDVKDLVKILTINRSNDISIGTIKSKGEGDVVYEVKEDCRVCLYDTPYNTCCINLTKGQKISYDSLATFPVHYLIKQNNSINEEVILLNENAKCPTKGSLYSACYDLYSPVDTVVPPNSNLLIKTGVVIAWDNPNYYMQLLSRSGLVFKNNIVVEAGVIDFDYRKEIGVILQNNKDEPFIVNKGDRIAQYTYLKIANVTSKLVSEFTIPLESNRNGGFGSTGI